MIKCKWIKKTDKAKYKIKGNVKAIALEVLTVIKEAYQIASPLERAMLKDLILSNLKDNGPVFGGIPMTVKYDPPLSKDTENSPN